MPYLHYFSNRTRITGLILIALTTPIGCVHTNNLGNFKVSQTKLSSTKSRIVTVVLDEPDVKDVYNNGKGYVYTGVYSQLKSAFTKKLKPNFKKVFFAKSISEGKKSDVILTVSFEIKDVSSDPKNKCAIDFRVQALTDGGQKNLSINEDSGFEDLWFSGGRDECRNVMNTLFDKVVDPVLNDISLHFK